MSEKELAERVAKLEELAGLRPAAEEKPPVVQSPNERGVVTKEERAERLRAKQARPPARRGTVRSPNEGPRDPE